MEGTGRRAILACMLMLLGFRLATSMAVCGSGCPTKQLNFYYSASSNGCYLAVAEPATWTSAQQNCKSLHKDAHLVVINSAIEQQALASYLNATDTSAVDTACAAYGLGNGWWTGAQRIEPSSETTFYWKSPVSDTITTLIDMTYTNWYSGSGDQEPNFLQSDYPESCMNMFSGGGWNYRWNDQNCNAALCYICEIGLQ